VVPAEHAQAAPMWREKSKVEMPAGSAKLAPEPTLRTPHFLLTPALALLAP
jgi:hypothetical protein